MTLNRMAQSVFGFLLFLAIVTTVAVQVRSAPSSSAVLVDEIAVGEDVRLKLSLSLQKLPANLEEAAKANCKPWPNGRLPKECSQFAGLDGATVVKPDGVYRVELRLHDAADFPRTVEGN